jgi:type I restriction enzyme S subunit
MMEGWKVEKIKDLEISLIDGDRGKNYPKQNEFSTSGHCLFLNTGNVTSEGFDFSTTSFITNEKDQLLRKGKLITNDIILTTRGTVGNVAHFHSKIPFNHVRINSGMLIIRANNKQFDNRFLYQVLKSPVFNEQVKQFQYGAAQPQLPIRTLNHIKLPIPPLPTQRKIASILSAYDDLIENNLKRIKLLEEKAQLTYEEWFVRMKFPGHETATFDEETGLPEGWERKSLKKLSKKITKGTTPTSLKKQFTDEGVNFIKAESYSDDGFFKYEKFAFIDEETNELLKRSKLEEFDVLVSIAGVLGRVALISKAVLPANTNQAVGIVRLHQYLISPYYIRYFLSSEYMNKLINIISGQAAQPNINLTQLGLFKVNIPPKEINKKFHDLIHSVFETQQSLVLQNQLLKEARDILLPRLMTGMIDTDEIVGTGVDGMK